MISFVEDVNHFLKSYWEQRAPEVRRFSPALLASMEYSLNSGGKRFRPSLCLQAAKLLKVETSVALPFAAALEMIHTYSLIHDDLPCMDDDNERRGQPTNHIRYGEPLALLAGDGLLTEAFVLVSQSYQRDASMGLNLVSALARAASASGMVGGQALDMDLGVPMSSAETLLVCHVGKTAVLIASALEGAGVLAALNSAQTESLRLLGEKIGLAFQIKDDLLDQENAPNSVLFYWSQEQIENYLKTLKLESEQLFVDLPSEMTQLFEYFSYNDKRTH